MQATDSILSHPFEPISRRLGLLRWLLPALVAGVYVASYSPHWWIGKDGALFLNLARSLASGEGYTLAGDTQSQVPPGFPVLLAAMMKLNLGNFAAVNLVMLLTGLATLWVSYLLLRELADKGWALAIAFVLALSREMVQRSGEVLSDLPFMLLVASAILLYYKGNRPDAPKRKYWEVASLLLVVSCWFRLAGVPLVFGAAAGLVLSARRGHRRRAVLSAAMVAAGLAITLGIFYFHYASSHVATASSEADRFKIIAEGRINPLTSFYWASGQLSRLYFAQRMPNVICMIVLVAPVAAAMFNRLRRRDWIGPLAVACYVGAMCVLAAKVRTRYFMPIAPLLLLYLAEGWAWILTRWLESPRARAGVIAGLLAVILASNSPLIARLVYRKHQPDFATHQQRGRYRYLHPTAEFLRAQSDRGGIIGEQTVGLLADRPCPTIARSLITSSPSRERLRELLAGWNIRYVVVNLEKKYRDPFADPLRKQTSSVSPFDSALREYLDNTGELLFVYDQIEVHRLPAD